MRQFILSIFSFFFIFSTNAQVGMGDWKMYISPNASFDIVYGNGIVYGILENALLEYDINAEEQTIWSVANYLSDVSPTALGIDKQSNSLLIGYANGNIDLLQNNKVHNIPYLFQSTVNGVKGINRIVVHQGYAYFATGIGIVVLNLGKKEIKDTYYPTDEETAYLDLAILDNKMYVLTKDAVYMGDLSNHFLADFGQWQKLSSIPDYSHIGKYQEIEVFNDRLFISYRNDSIPLSDTLFQLTNNDLTVFSAEEMFFGINGSGKELLISTYDGLFAYSETLELNQIIFNYVGKGSPHPRNAIEVNENYFIADRENGIIKTWDSYNTEYITFPGPRYNSAYRVEWLNDVLAVACGSLFGPLPAYNQMGGVVEKNDKWESIVITDDKMLKGTATWDFICTAINPINPDEVAFGTRSGIPLVLTHSGQVVDTFSTFSSLIEGDAQSGSGHISDLTYDDKGNLWLANANSSKPLKVRTKDGIWYDFDLGNEAKSRITKRVIVDRNDVKWLSVEDAGLIAFDNGGDFDNLTNDRYKLFNTGPNTGDLPSNKIEAMASDFDNNIWIGTPEGMRVLYNSDNFFDAAPGEYNFQKLLIEFGENVEIVLGTTHITAIVIDGDNRKWIGTASSGVFLLSQDGLEVERNFTSENSPLLSNTILDITINHTTGEVYFVTEKGMIIYRSDASQGDPDYNNVVVFPNPFRPDYQNPVTIQGIAYDSDIKITDVSGRLVYKTRSHGGTATWSGNTMDGERAATGVYLIWTSIDDENFKGREVGKFLLIN